jgi:hypothetical protein
MNRQFHVMLAVTLTIAWGRPCVGQGQVYPPPGPHWAQAAYPTQPAIYLNTPAGAATVSPNIHPHAMTFPPAAPSSAAPAVYLSGHPGAAGSAPPGYVQRVSGVVYPTDPGYGPVPMEESGTLHSDMAGAGCDAGGCDAAGCDSAGCDSGGASGDCCGRGLFGGCGIFGQGGLDCGDGSCYGGGDGCGVGGMDGHCFGGYHGLCGQEHGPYGSGGCCLPRWFDVHAEWLFWKRDLDESLSFSSNGILGPDALNADQLDFSEESGVRVTGAYLLGVATGLEFSYFGGLNWASGASATSPGEALFSVFSDFGSNPLNGFPETDFAFLHEIGLSSELDNGEINLRHRWVSASCVLHQSVLVGARYFRLREDLIYNTRTTLGAMDYKVKTDNDLIGAQLGGDTYVCITPRLKVGAEVEAGVFGTSNSQRTTMVSTIGPNLQEYNRENDVAFLGEAGLSALFRATSQLTLRVGYQVLYVDGVALAVDNFNTASPFSARDSFLDNGGDVFYHGATLGFEWTH